MCKLLTIDERSSPDQQRALESIVHWRERWPRSKQALTLGGLAGTGKSTLVAHLANYWSNVAVACPTGKAASLLCSKGIQAQTVHSLIYRPITQGKRVRFLPKAVLDADTIIVDEASMINRDLYRDLCSFMKPILFVGDHGQLEPIGEAVHLMKDPDVRLESIHRQAEGNTILRLAQAFREGRERIVRRAMHSWQDKTGACTLATRGRLEDFLFQGMQVIVGFNSLRHELNAKIRKKLGFRGPPMPGDRLVCLRNNARFNVFNGQECVVRSVRGGRRNVIELEVELEDGRCLTVPCLARQFGANPIQDHRDPGIALMDFGYALTVHKAQGSAWPAVLVIESLSSSWDARRWRYTAVTRAIERIVYCF